MTELRDRIEAIILRRLRENKIDGYTLTMAEEIAEAFQPSSPVREGDGQATPKTASHPSPTSSAVADLFEAMEQIAGYKPIKQPAMWTRLPRDVAADAIRQFKKAESAATPEMGASGAEGDQASPSLSPSEPSGRGESGGIQGSASEASMNKWRTIDSAPRDGTHVLLFAPAWPAPNTGWTFGFDDWQNCPYHHAGNPSWKPTHWQPLPSAPIGSAPPSDEGGSMPPSSSDRDAVIEECAVIAENDLHRNTGAIIAKAIRSLKSPPTVG